MWQVPTRCSEFNFNSFFNFLSKHETLYKQNFLEYTFQIMILKLSIIVTRNNSLEIRVVKLRFLLIYEIMLKSIATARSECTTKQENEGSYNTD